MEILQKPLQKLRSTRTRDGMPSDQLFKVITLANLKLSQSFVRHEVIMVKCNQELQYLNTFNHMQIDC